MKLFQDDPGTEAILMIGEIGGTAEERAAEYIAKNVTKPVAAFIAGQTAPPGRRMGHAGAIISGGSGSAKDKIAALQKAGIEVAPTPADLGTAVQKAMARRSKLIHHRDTRTREDSIRSSLCPLCLCGEWSYFSFE